MPTAQEQAAQQGGWYRDANGNMVNPNQVDQSQYRDANGNLLQWTSGENFSDAALQAAIAREQGARGVSATQDLLMAKKGLAYDPATGAYSKRITPTAGPTLMGQGQYQGEALLTPQQVQQLADANYQRQQAIIAEQRRAQANPDLNSPWAIQAAKNRAAQQSPSPPPGLVNPQTAPVPTTQVAAPTLAPASSFMTPEQKIAALAAARQGQPVHVPQPAQQNLQQQLTSAMPQWKANFKAQNPNATQSDIDMAFGQFANTQEQMRLDTEKIASGNLTASTPGRLVQRQPGTLPTGGLGTPVGPSLGQLGAGLVSLGTPAGLVNPETPPMQADSISKIATQDLQYGTGVAPSPVISGPAAYTPSASGNWLIGPDGSRQNVAAQAQTGGNQAAAIMPSPVISKPAAYTPSASGNWLIGPDGSRQNVAAQAQTGGNQADSISKIATQDLQYGTVVMPSVAPLMQRNPVPALAPNIAGGGTMGNGLTTLPPTGMQLPGLTPTLNKPPSSMQPTTGYGQPNLAAQQQFLQTGAPKFPQLPPKTVTQPKIVNPVAQRQIQRKPVNMLV